MRRSLSLTLTALLAVPVVTVVTAGSASALPGGPVLVVPSCGTLPTAIAEEIRRLGATR